MMYRKSFTLIELLTVIAIIGVLISISVVSWVAVAQRGRDSTRKSDLARIKQALQQEYSDTRLYPFFDKDKGQIYAASWQLTFDGLKCTPHQAGTRLTPKYMAEIPRDPRDTLNYSGDSADCTALASGQANRYLYISSPTDPNNGPEKKATGFALMATLEKPGNDEMTPDSTLNPLGTQYTGSAFGIWYANQRNYDSPILVNANYLVDSKNQ